MALLAAVRALGKARAWRLQRPIVPMLLQGEHWGRMGSRTLGLDMGGFKCDPGQTVSASDSPTGKPYCRAPLRWDLAFQNVSLARAHAAIALAGIGSNATAAPVIGLGRGTRTLFVHQPQPDSTESRELLTVL